MWKKIFFIVSILYFLPFILYSEEINIYSDILEYDEKEKIIKAEGNVRLEKENISLESSYFLYNLESAEGVLKNCFSEIGDFKIKGEETYIRKDTYLVKNGEFTTCNKKFPHYKFSAREILIKDRKITARKVSLRLNEKRIFTLKKISLRIKGLPEEKEKKNIFSPEIGISGREKIFLRWSYKHNFNKYFSLSSFSRYSFWFGFQGGINISGEKNGSRIENILSKTFEQKQVLPDTWVKRYPEIKIKNERKFLNTDISYYLGGSWGKFEEEGKKSERRKIETQISTPEIYLSNTSFLKLILSYEKSKYSLNDFAVKDLKYETILEKKFKKNSTLQITYINHRLSGKTPFIFDSVELKEEMQNKISKSLKENYNLQTIFRIDLTKNKIYDTEFILEYKLDCFVTTLRWCYKKNLWNIILKSNLFESI